MKKLADALTELIAGDQMLQLGLQERLFNFTHLAKYLRPLLIARMHKDISVASVLMALSRLQKKFRKISSRPEHFRVHSITVHGDLCTFSFEKTSDMLRRIHVLHTAILRDRGYITISESTNEVTVIAGRSYIALARRIFGRRTKFQNTNIAAIALRFPAIYSTRPGFLSLVLQQVTLQGINIIEVASTYTEFVLYIDARDAKLAFDTLHILFRTH
jgi:aspartokinase